MMTWEEQALKLAIGLAIIAPMARTADYRELMIALEGEGFRPCLTARNTYLPGSCSLCSQPCILAAGHPSIKARSDAVVAQQKEERRLNRFAGKKTRKANPWRVYPPGRKSPKKAQATA